MSEPPVLTGSVVSVQGSRKYSGVDMTELSKAVEEWSASLPEDLSEFRTDHSVLERFLVARQLDKEQAAEMLRAHKAWRAATLPVELTAEVKAEIRKGKYFMSGKDREGRPLFVVRSGLFDPKERDLDTSVKGLVYSLEYALSLSGDPAQKFVILYDRTGFSIGKNLDRDFLKAAGAVLSDNYPERLANAYIYPCGLVLNGIWNIVKWFLDPRTRAKFEMVTSNQALLDLFDRDQLPDTLGGTAAVQLPC